MQAKETFAFCKLAGILLITVAIGVTLILLLIRYTSMGTTGNLMRNSSTNQIALALTNSSKEDQIEVKLGENSVKGSGREGFCIIACGLTLLGLAYITAKMKL